MTRLRGSKYKKGNVWWVRMPLPPGQTWTARRTGRQRTVIEVSVRKWYRSAGIDGKGVAGEAWATRLLCELNAKYYSGETVVSRSLTTSVRDLMKNLATVYEEQEKRSLADAESKSRIFERHGLLDVIAAELTTERLRVYRKQRLENDHVKSSTVNHDFALLRRAYRLGVRHTPPLVTAVPYFPFGKGCERRQSYLTLHEYHDLTRLFSDDVRPFFVAGVHLGLRVAVLLEMRWSWIELFDQERSGVFGVIRIPAQYLKNRGGLTTVIFGDLGTELQSIKRKRDQQFSKSDHVFVRQPVASGNRRDSGPVRLKYSYVRKRWREAVAAIGRPELVMHDMRRTALDLFKSAGLRREECMQWLGHKTQSMYEWYSIDLALEDKLRQAPAIAARFREGAETKQRP